MSANAWHRTSCSTERDRRSGRWSLATLLCVGLSCIHPVQAHSADIAAPPLPGERSSLLWSSLHPWQDPLGAMPDLPAGDLTADLPAELRLSPTPCGASAAQGNLALPQAIELALCHNPQVRATWSEIRQQAAQVGEARAAYLPTANMSISRLDDYVSYPGSSYPDAHKRSNRTSLTVNWRVFDFGTRSANLEAARGQLGAALSTRNAMVLKVVLQVLQAYEDAQSAQAVLHIRQSLRDLAVQTLASAERRERLGVGARTDTLQAQAALSRVDLQVSQARGRWLENQAVLVYVLGLPAGSPIRLPISVDDIASRQPEGARRSRRRQVTRELDQWLAQARQHHPAIAAARAQWRAAAAKVRATQAEGLPGIDLSFGYYDNGRPTQNVASYRSRESILGLTLNIPIFDGFAHTYRVQGARAQAELSRIQYEDTAENTLQDLVKLHARTLAAWDSLKAADELQHASQAAEASTRRQFDKGVTDMLHLIQAQNDLTDAKLQRLAAQLQWQEVKLEMMVNDF